jgi:hypothetical protein
MDRDTFNTAIRAFKNRTPFQPFTLSMVNGERLEVDHPDAVHVHEGLGVFFGPGGVLTILDHEGVARVIGDLASQRDS